MGLFGGKSEEELRTAGTATTARVVYVDDTGKRRENGTEAKVKIQLKIDSGAARGRELDKAKWVPVTKMPHVGETVQIRFDPDDIDDWAWGDAAMYQPARPAGAPAIPPPPGMNPPPPPGSGPPAPMAGAPQMAEGDDAMVEFIQNAAGPWGKTPGFKQMVENALAMGHAQQVQWIQASGDPNMQQQWLSALQSAGYKFDQSTGQVIQPHAGMPQGAMPPAASPAGPPSPALPGGEDPETRLRKLDKLLADGLVTPDEHRELRQKIIDSI
jgi:hypothetical protein